MKAMEPMQRTRSSSLSRYADMRKSRVRRNRSQKRDIVLERVFELKTRTKVSPIRSL